MFNREIAKRLTVLPILVLCLKTVMSCTETSRLNSNLEEYTSRLSRVLNTDFPAAPAHQKYVLPPVSALVAPLPVINIEITELLSLRQCELSTLVANKNTTLGKVQLPSQQLIYELTLVKALKDCEAVLDPSSAIYKQLQSWRRAKKGQLSFRWSNFVQSSQDVRVSLTQAVNTKTSEDAAIRGYFYLETLRTNITKAQSQAMELESVNALEGHLYELQKARFPATTWSAQNEITRHLSSLNQSLGERLPSVNCAQGRPSETAKILRNVFYLFFIEQVQPVASEVTALHYKISPVFEAWLQSPALHDEFKEILHANHTIGFSNYQAAMQEHVELWQTFLARCNLSPTTSG